MTGIEGAQNQEATVSLRMPLAPGISKPVRAERIGIEDPDGVEKSSSNFRQKLFMIRALPLEPKVRSYAVAPAIPAALHTPYTQ